MTLTKKMPKSIQFALCVLVGFLGGRSLLLDVSPKWTAAFIMAMGFAAFLLMVGNPKRVLLFTLALIVPFYIGKDFIYYTRHIAQVDAAGFYLSDALVVALLMLYLGRLAIDRQTEIRPFPSTTVPALAWLIAGALSLINARRLDPAAIQMIIMGKLILLYFVVANNVEDEKDVKWLVSGLALGVLCQGLLGVYQGITGQSFGRSSLAEGATVMQQVMGARLVHRVEGTLGYPNSYAMYLSATMSFVLALLFSEVRGLYKALAGIVLCIGALGLVFSLSRGGWISFVVVFIVVLALACRRRRLNVHVALVVGGAILLILLALTLSQSDLIMGRLTSDDQGSAVSRITMAKSALAIIQDYPLLGAGLNNYGLYMSYYKTRYLTHNTLLLITAETGLIGLVAFLWFLASVLVQAWRLVSRAPNDTLWMAGCGILSAYISLSVHSMVDYALVSSVQVFTLFWLLAGMAAGLSRGPRSERSVTKRLQF